MAFSTVWRRLTARKRKRSSFYDSQDVMRRAIEAEAAARAGKPSVAPVCEPVPDGDKARRA